MRYGVQQRPGVGVRGPAEHCLAGTELDDPPGVHHRDPVGDVGHHGQVVRYVQRGDPVAAAQLAHGLEHLALGRDVQPGGRLIQDQHLGSRQEGHGQRDPLHLAAGQLVRVTGQELVVIWQADLAQPGSGPL